MPAKDVDYSLYLVTDSTPAVLGNKDLVSVVKAAVDGGTTYQPALARIAIMLTCNRRDTRTIP